MEHSGNSFAPPIDHIRSGNIAFARRCCRSVIVTGSNIATAEEVGPNPALVYAWTGERDLVIEQLESLAKTPGGPTYGDLRFEKTVAALAPK